MPINSNQKFVQQKKQLQKKWQFVVSYVRVVGICIQLLVYRFFKKNIIVISLFESIGDILACTPVAMYMKKRCPSDTIVWVLNKNYRSLVNTNQHVDQVIGLDFFYQWIWLRKLLLRFMNESRIIDLHIAGKPSAAINEKLYKRSNGITFGNYLSNGNNLLQSFSIAAGLPALNDPPFFNIKTGTLIKSLPEKYVVVHPRSNMKIKDWVPSKWNDLCSTLIQMGYSVFEIGLSTEISVNDSKYINYTGRKDFHELAYLISNASLFIGVDSGFAHLANALQKEGLVLIGRYMVGGYVYENYNPFSGEYAKAEHIMFAKNGAVETLATDKVIKRVMDKLMLRQMDHTCSQ